MSYSLVLQSEAIIDIQEAYDWYELQKKGLGLEFLGELELGQNKICKHPEYYYSVTDIFRRLKINRFPYVIVYEIEGDTVIVIAVRHTKKKPKY